MPQLRFIRKILITLLLSWLAFCCNTSYSPVLDKSDKPLLMTDILVGFDEENITPPIGMRLCGTFEERLSTGVHDSLYVRAFVFSQRDTKFAIAGCDLAMVFPFIGDSVRARVRKLGLPAHHVLIHASETHNGPDYFGEFRNVFHESAIKEYGQDPAEPVDYIMYLIDRITLAIENADKAQKPSELCYTSGECKGIAFNRRFKMNDGSVGWNPGKLNPKVIEPLGPVDETVPVLSIFQDNKSTPSAVLTGFAMHLAILDDDLYAADYPYYLSRRLSNLLSADLFVHFLQSPCCEVNHIDISTNRAQSGHQWAQVVGERLADTVRLLLNQNTGFLDPELSVLSKIIKLELQQFSKDTIENKRRIWYSPERTKLPFLEVVHAGKVTGINEVHSGGPVSVLVQAFQFDPETVLVGMPSEVSVEIGLKIRENSPFKNTMMVQLSNDWFGYIPTRRIFDEGHYEAIVAKIKPGEAEKLLNEVLDLLNEMKIQ